MGSYYKHCEPNQMMVESQRKVPFNFWVLAKFMLHNISSFVQAPYFVII